MVKYLILLLAVSIIPVLAAPPVYQIYEKAEEKKAEETTATEQAAPADADTQAVPAETTAVSDTAPAVLGKKDKKKKLKSVLTACPPDMQYVIVDYNPKRVYEICADQYEYPNQKGRFPMVEVSWYKAKRLCKDKGKYLCWDKEWGEACLGLNNWDYSYYNVYDEEKCNVRSDEVKKIGDNPECKTRNYEIWDLVGNVREWVAGGGIGCMGGSFKHGRGARCSRWDALSIKRTYKDVGFRCCLRIDTGRYGKVEKEKRKGALQQKPAVPSAEGEKAPEPPAQEEPPGAPTQEKAPEGAK